MSERWQEPDAIDQNDSNEGTFVLMRRMIRVAEPDDVFGVLCGDCGSDTYVLRVVEREGRLLCQRCENVMARLDLSHDARVSPN